MKRILSVLLLAVLLMLAALPAVAEGGYVSMTAYLTQDSVFGTEKVTIKNGDQVKTYANMVVMIVNLRGAESGCRLIGLDSMDEPESIDFYSLPENTVMKQLVLICQNWETISEWMNEGTSLALMISAGENQDPIFITNAGSAANFAKAMEQYLYLDD